MRCDTELIEISTQLAARLCSDCMALSWETAGEPIDPHAGVALALGDLEVIADMEAVGAPASAVKAAAIRGIDPLISRLPPGVWIDAAPGLWISCGTDRELVLLAITGASAAAV